MDLEQIEKHYRGLVSRGDRGTTYHEYMEQLKFELLLEIAKDLKTFRDDYQYHNQRGV